MNTYVFRRPGNGQLITIQANSVHEARNKMRDRYGNAYYPVANRSPVVDSRKKVTTDESGEPTPY